MSSAVNIQKILSQLSEKTKAIKQHHDENEVVIQGILRLSQYFNQGTLSLLAIAIILVWLAWTRIVQVRRRNQGAAHHI